MNLDSRFDMYKHIKSAVHDLLFFYQSLISNTHKLHTHSEMTGKT